MNNARKANENKIIFKHCIYKMNYINYFPVFYLRHLGVTQNQSSWKCSFGHKHIHQEALSVLQETCLQPPSLSTRHFKRSESLKIFRDIASLLLFSPLSYF